MAKTLSEALASAGIATASFDAIKKKDPQSLKQYGVKGMHWGVTRDRKTGRATITSPGGNSKDIKFNPRKVSVAPSASGKGYTVEGNKREVKKTLAEIERVSVGLRRMDNMSPDFQKAYVARTKHPSELDNNDMRALIDRMRLEQDYSRLLAQQVSLVPKPPPSKIAAGRKFTTDMLKEIGKQEVKRVTRAVVQQNVNKVAKKRGIDLGEKKKKKGDNKDD